MKKLILTLTIILLISGCAQVMEGPYTVTRVVDGDTIQLNNTQKVRLSGINTPEVGECYYQQAKDKLTNLILNKEVLLEKDKTNTGKYGRLLRYVYINDLLINSLLIKEGYAKVYDKYSKETKKYDELKETEVIAKNNKLGVWNCQEKQNCQYAASKNSKTYHKKDCKWAKRIKQENLICFETREEAEKTGRKPCKACGKKI